MQIVLSPNGRMAESRDTPPTRRLDIVEGRESRHRKALNTKMAP